MKIAVLSSHTPSLFWFRMDMMKGFINNGHAVLAVGSDSEKNWKQQFKAFGIDYRQLHVERNGMNPLRDYRTFLELFRFMKDEKPDKIFTYQAKTIVYGCIAAHLNGIKEIYPLVAGLGSVFRGTGVKNHVIKTIMKIEYRVAFKCCKKVFFQNNDDKEEFINLQLIRADKTAVINGSGVNLEKFTPALPPDKPAFLYIGRLIRDKGVLEYLEACRIIKKKYPQVRCMLVGPYDSNPSAVKPDELKPYLEEGIIEYYGEQSDVRPFISQCSTYVLPSYHEGTPKTVLEAMAMERSIITSDAPGCRETVLDGVNGYLVKIKDIKGIADKMEFLISTPDLNRKMGENSLRIVKNKYDVNTVNHSIMQTMGLA